MAPTQPPPLLASLGRPLLVVTSLLVTWCAGDVRPSAAARFTFSTPATGMTAPTGQLTANLTGVSECACRLRCMADPACRSYGYSDALQTCHHTDALPEAAATTSDPDAWWWFSRLAPRWLGEPCDVGVGCDSPGSICLDAVCKCRPPRISSSDDTACVKTGTFVPVSAGRLDSSRMLDDIPVTTVADCQEICTGNLSCVAFALSADSQTCTLYALGVTHDAGPADGRKAFVWQFTRPDGVPPAGYMAVGNQWVKVLEQITTVFNGAHRCAVDDAILFPPTSREAIEAVTAAGASFNPDCENVGVGVDDLITEGDHMLSDGSAADALPWYTGEPNNAGDGENCVVLYSCTPHVIDVPMKYEVRPLCQFVGENLALRRQSWMNVPAPDHQAALGNDGVTTTMARTPSDKRPPTADWTVDLGGVRQVTAVLWVAGTCCSYNQPGTEVLVGTDPRLFDANHSSVCVTLERQFIVDNYARLFRCPLPLSGRYVRVRRYGKPLEVGELAVYGNRLELP